MDLGEAIAFDVPDGPMECPFDHTNSPPKEVKQVMPRWEKNDAAALGAALGPKYHFQTPLDITVNGEAHKAQYTPHHLIPGNATWPKTKLRKWVDKRPRTISDHIGYDVNGFDNGVSLPGNAGYRATGKSWKTYKWQQAYAFAAMDASVPTRQFHDAHPAYNEFVTGVLDKIAEKIEQRVKETGTPGCGKKNCAGDSQKQKPYPPPYELIDRLRGVALRLEGYLVCSPRAWRDPIFTSRFARAYAQAVRSKKK
ncbi:MAG: AHH domain-containing protein [Gemmatimonadetes bacterium]|nr:AHH domain-containing protein [Gemmatimonadota bacterium]